MLELIFSFHFIQKLGLSLLIFCYYCILINMKVKYNLFFTALRSWSLMNCDCLVGHLKIILGESIFMKSHHTPPESQYFFFRNEHWGKKPSVLSLRYDSDVHHLVGGKRDRKKERKEGIACLLIHPIQAGTLSSHTGRYSLYFTHKKTHWHCQWTEFVHQVKLKDGRVKIGRTWNLPKVSWHRWLS